MRVEDKKQATITTQVNTRHKSPFHYDACDERDCREGRRNLLAAERHNKERHNKEAQFARMISLF